MLLADTDRRALDRSTWARYACFPASFLRALDSLPPAQPSDELLIRKRSKNPIQTSPANHARGYIWGYISFYVFVDIAFVRRTAVCSVEPIPPEIPKPADPSAGFLFSALRTSLVSQISVPKSTRGRLARGLCGLPITGTPTPQPARCPILPARHSGRYSPHAWAGRDLPQPQDSLAFDRQQMPPKRSGLRLG